MATGFITIPTKKTSEVDIVKPIRDFICYVYTDLKSSDYEFALTEFGKLRSLVVAKLSDKTESALDVLCRYYDQLTALEGKLPVSENQIRIDFKWQDAITKKVRGFASSGYEKACVLFSIAAMQTQVADGQNISTDEGLKAAAKLFQQSSGIFAYLVSFIPTILQNLPVCDIHPDVLNAFSSLTLAEAQACFVRKAINDKMKPGVIAKLAFQCSLLYTDALKLMQLDTLKSFWPKEWPNSASSHQDLYLAIAQYHQSQADKEGKKFAELVARLRVANECMLLVEKRGGSSSVGPLFTEFRKTVDAALQQAEKDNGFIYHVRVPDASSLPPVEKAVVAKSTPLSGQLSQNFVDLFQKVVPMVIRNAVTTFEFRKSEIMFHEVGRLRDATTALNSLLVSYNLPAAIEDLSGDRVPQSLLGKAATVRQCGGIDYLARIITELPQLLQFNKTLVEQAERDLAEEEATDRQLRAQFGTLWTLTPSDALNQPMRQELAKHRTIIMNAIGADALVHQRYATNRNAIALLSQPDTDIERSLPPGNPVAALQGSSTVLSLRQQLDEVHSIKEGRDKIETQLKDIKCDIASSFLSALMQDGALNEAALCSQHLDRIYGPLREQVAQSLKRQDVVVKQIQQLYGEFSKAKTHSQASVVREKQLRDLAMAYDSFIELKANIEEGTKFYNDLIQLLTKFRTKVSEFCTGRRAETDELLKELTGGSAAARQPTSPGPAVIPTYQQTHPLSAPTYLRTASMTGNPVSTVQIGHPSSFGTSTYFAPALPTSYNPYARR